MTKTIVIANQKGGVGKTTTTMNIGVALAKQNYRVLMIDNDPQANLSSYLGIEAAGPNAARRTLDEVYLLKRPVTPDLVAELVTKTASGVDIIASDTALSGVEYYLFSRNDRELVLRQFLHNIQSRYDYILIDTPPSLNLLTLNALCAATHVLIPVQPEFFGLEGIVKLREAIANVQNRWNPNLKLLGVLPTLVTNRRKLTSEVLGALKSELQTDLFNTQIHDNAAVTESTGHAQSVFDYDRTSKGAKDYWAAALEVIERSGGQNAT